MRRFARRGIWLVLAATLLQSGAPSPARCQAYRLRADRVEVSTRTHWQAWQAPAGLSEVSVRGVVSPAQIEATVDATDNASDFSYTIAGNLGDQYDLSYKDGNALVTQGGIKRAGTNSATAARSIDGDTTTYWEPRSTDPLGNWWVEIDLGRLVSATRVVVRFAEDSSADRADPMLQFRIHSAGGQNPFGTADQSGALDYTLVGGTTKPNKDQRQFEFDLTPLGPHTDEWTGRVLQYLRISATDTDLDRAEQVSQDEYEALGSRDRGAVDHIWRIGGEERLVTAARYAELEAEEQGGIRYFRHERPKLAEVEVWTAGVNIGLGILDRGGSLTDPNNTAFAERGFDGRITTDWDAIAYSTVGDIAGWGVLRVDLGALFRLRAVRTVTRVLGHVMGRGNLLYGYELRGSDGSLAPDGTLIWDMLSTEERLLNSNTRLFEDPFEPRNIRYLEFRNVDVSRRTRAHEGHRYPSQVSEMQIYPEGYVPELVMTSGFIDMQQSRSLTIVSWDADVPSGTAVEIRTRTGDELKENTRYFNAQGKEQPSREAYDKLPSFMQGEILNEVLAGPGWSNWSQAYVESGEVVRSPSPRQYMEIEARLLTSDPEAAASLNSINVSFVNPVAESVAAEIHPKREVPLGEPVEFQVFIRPQYVSGNPRVDRVRVVSPAMAAMSLRQVARGSAAAFLAGSETAFTLQEDGLLVDAAGSEARVVGEGTDTLDVALPRLLANLELVRLTFTAVVYQSGSTFSAAVGNGNRDGVWQAADAGDVLESDAAAGGGMTVLTPLEGTNILTFGVNPPVVTPNGDRVNDEAVFEFAVLRINAERRAEVAIYDISGRLVRRLTETRSPATGRYAIAWDGADEAGGVVPPGVYVARIDVDNDGSGSGAATRLVHVAY